VGNHDVGISALAMLAMIGRGNTHRVGNEKKCVKAGLDWLLAEQREDGCFGPRSSESWMYDTALASMAVCELFAVSRDFRLEEPARRAVGFLLNAQNANSGWRYEPGCGQSDSSVTGWVILALKTARNAGIDVPDSVFEGALAWFDSVTDEEGRAGYISPGDTGSNIKGVNDHFIPKPTMTAVSVLCQLLSGRSRMHPNVKKGVDILMENLPKWDSVALRDVDMYYWYYGTYAMHQYGGPKWEEWKRAVNDALLAKQVVGGCADGSWEPEGKWGLVGGRVYATSINMLTLGIVHRSEHHDHPIGERVAQND
jgi:hypothetical protein